MLIESGLGASRNQRSTSASFLSSSSSTQSAIFLPPVPCAHTHTPFSLSKPPLSSASALDLTRLDFGLDSTRYSTRTIPPPFCPSFDPTRSQVALSCSFYLLPHPRRTIHKTERRSDPGNCVSDFLSVSLPILWRHSSSMLLCSALPRFCVAQRRDVDIQCAKFLWSLGAPRTSLLRHGGATPGLQGLGGHTITNLCWYRTQDICSVIETVINPVVSAKA